VFFELPAFVDPEMMKHLYYRCLFCLAILCAWLRPGTAWSQTASFERPRLLEIARYSLVFEAPQGAAELSFGRTEQLEMGTIAPQTVYRDGRSAAVFQLDNLEPATVYYARINDGSTGVFITQSTSTGQISAYFNQPVETSYADPVPASYLPGEQLFNLIKAKINAAYATIDVAAYNTNRPDLVAALTDAANRGVRVRYVTDIDESNTALNPAPVFPVMEGAPGSSIRMHNKFIVIDADYAQDCWVVGGSMNFTDGNINDDPNNVVVIQDQSLALAYEMEFEEMWGSSGAAPNAANSRFGSQKLDNTPHLFNIGGVPVESYFSPSDGVSAQMVSELNNSDTQILFSLLTFTYDPTAQAICASSATVRGLIDNINDTGSEFNFLTQTCGLSVRDWTDPGQFHHKYGVIDADDPQADPVVITGSHNWSASAENNNDENTLIIHDHAIANQFRQEFEARWCETLNLANCMATGITQTEQAPWATLVPMGSPSPVLTVRLTTAQPGSGTLALFSVAGQRLAEQVLSWNTGDQIIHFGSYPAGAYLLQLTGQQGTTAQLVVVGAP
jgi:hypothetical protein